MAADLILVNGIPGTGKTTLVKKLQADLKIPILQKDFLKEALYDELGHRDQPWSKMLGFLVFRWLYEAIEVFLAKDEPILVECAFIKEFSDAPIRKSVSAHNANCVEIYCETEPKELVRRFNARLSDGTRHPGHGDASMIYSEELREHYAPLEIGTTIYVDTTHFDDVDYQKLLSDLKGKLTTPHK